MIGVWNRSLTARFVAVMLLALAVSQGISFLLFTDEMGGVLLRAAKVEFLSRSASVAQVLETTPPNVQHDILQASGTSYTRFWVTPNFPGDVESWRQDAKGRLAEPLPTLANLAGTEQGVRETTADPVPAPQPASITVAAPVPSSGAPYSTWLDLPAHAWPLSRAAKFMYWGDATGMGLAVQLKDGSWLNSAFSKKMANSMLSARSLISLGVTAFILSLCAAFIARTMTKPMRRLAAAAEALGRGESVAPLLEKGPDDLRHTAAAFNLMQSRLQRFVEDRTRMLAAIGHDLRTPITSLRLRAEFVSDDETREKMFDTLDELRAMTEATLAFSREQATEEVTRNVDLTALVGSLCDDLVELGYEISCVEGPKISYRCRPDALKRAVRNLVENAVRYGERARVALRATPQAIEIVIEDDGPGIPSDIAEKVFEPFFRMERSRNRETGGIGLGLSISRNMVRHHGGDITLTNTGQGLRATISLPHAQSPGPEAKGPVRARRRAGLPIGARTPAE
ncbi:signal transduction histidine kinase [Ancylobacter aquaticus]|uniref:histidine kinase n=1 Tax=Ancylobacter aquaticus TaxID=100 RepID=A0A4R1I647_ANCAQ|nr:HAMP domain-containing sensor histidine kinase [Ancylobacter aquaticus]TCK28129.1 signal transduction histidine kinase [Ancylobacter aquaticus]